MHRRVLVTGANGFIGRYVARHLSQQGWHVDGMGHGRWPMSSANTWGVSAWYETDITLQALLDYEETPNLIVHCAGSGSVAASIAEPYLDFQRTVNSTLDVLEYIRTKSPYTSIVYPSSAAVYGACGPEPIQEGRVLKPLSPYGRHKLIAETLIQEYADCYGVKAAIVRLFSVYGPELRKQLLWEACLRLGKGENLFFGSGNETRDWLHVIDAASLLSLAAIHTDQSCTIVNGGSGVATSNRQVLELVAQSMGLALAPQFNNQVRPGDPQHYWADIASIKKWGWQPRLKLTEGIADYVAWAIKEQV